MCCCAPKGRPQKRPTVRQTAVCTFLALALIIAGAVAFYITGYNAFTNSSDRLVRAVDDFAKAKELGNELQGHSTNVSDSIQELKSDCKAFYDQYFKGVGDTLETSLGEVEQFTVRVDQVANNIDKFKVKYDEFKPYFLVALALPTALVAFLCVTMSLEVFTTRFACGLGFTKFMNCCCVRFTSIFVICTIVVVAATAAALFVLIIAGSSLCGDDVDGTVLNYMDSYVQSNFQGQIARHYILGIGSNPIQLQLDQAMHGLSSTSRNVTTYSALLDQACPKWDSAKLQLGLNQSSMVLDKCTDLIAPEAIYPYYSETVHGDVCGNVIAGSTVLVVLQGILGVLVLPTVAEASTTFLWRWKMWQEQEQEHEALLQHAGAPEVLA